jgi:hypothetical protein
VAAAEGDLLEADAGQAARGGHPFLPGAAPHLFSDSSHQDHGPLSLCMSPPLSRPRAEQYCPQGGEGNRVPSARYRLLYGSSPNRVCSAAVKARGRRASASVAG